MRSMKSLLIQPILCLPTTNSFCALRVFIGDCVGPSTSAASSEAKEVEGSMLVMFNPYCVMCWEGEELNCGLPSNGYTLSSHIPNTVILPLRTHNDDVNELDGLKRARLASAPREARNPTREQPPLLSISLNLTTDAQSRKRWGGDNCNRAIEHAILWQYEYHSSGAACRYQPARL